MMSKTETFCYEEDEEEASSNSENDSTQDRGLDKKMSGSDLSESLNNHDVLVPNPSHVDQED